MKVEEIYMRQEIRQMLNEIGINKNTLKDMVKGVINEKLQKACKQAISETDVEGYVASYFKDRADRVLKEYFQNEVRAILIQKLWDTSVKVEIKDRSGNLISE